jgi:hypothetical protein
MGMAKPAQQPLQKPSIRNMIEDEAPTAASAFTPIHLPTIAASMIKYICWRIYPTMRGTANLRIPRVGEPTVISFVFAMFLSVESHKEQLRL